METGEALTRELTESRFPCQQCGATLLYKIGSRDLECQYCGFTNEISRGDETIRELGYQRALSELQRSRPVSPATSVLSCPNCAAEFALDAHLHAGDCPFCGTTVVTGTGAIRPLKPKALLPFAIDAARARQSYQKWLSSLWFAPSALKKYARSDTQLNGVYVPYWTYDSDTVTGYRGERGDVYYVKQRYTVVENGRRVRRVRSVPKIRWTAVSGRTERHFDDVLIGATKTLPRKITDWLEPWDLHALEPYTEAYLSGFSSEVYQVGLDEGFNYAQGKMERIIRGDVTRAIGGDQQRIQQMQTQHSDTTFKHVLLPLWTAAFQFRDKTYRFVVNGRSGKTRGERPYSVVKITLAVLLGLGLAAAALFYASETGLLQQLSMQAIEFGSTDPFGGGFGDRQGYQFPDIREYRF